MEVNSHGQNIFPRIFPKKLHIKKLYKKSNWTSGRFSGRFSGRYFGHVNWTPEADTIYWQLSCVPRNLAQEVLLSAFLQKYSLGQDNVRYRILVNGSISRHSYDIARKASREILHHLKIFLPITRECGGVCYSWLPQLKRGQRCTHARRAATTIVNALKRETVTGSQVKFLGKVVS